MILIRETPSKRYVFFLRFPSSILHFSPVTVMFVFRRSVLSPVAVLCLHYETPSSAMTVFACVDFSAVTVCDTVIDLDGLIRSFDCNRPMQINDIN
jgi:hypothetical protein